MSENIIDNKYINELILHLKKVKEKLDGECCRYVLLDEKQIDIIINSLYKSLPSN